MAWEVKRKMMGIPCFSRNYHRATFCDSIIGGEFAANDAHRMQEREAIGVLVSLQGSFVHQSADGEVSQQEPVELLPDQVRRLAAQDDPGPPKMGFQFVQSRFDLPALMI